MQQKDAYDVKRVHKVNITVIICLVFMACGLVFFSSGFVEAMPAIVAGVSVIILTFLNYYLPVPLFIKSLLFPTLPVLVITGLFFVEGFALNQHYLLVACIAMIALYFKKELIIAFDIIFSACFILMYLLIPDSLIGGSDSFEVFITSLVAINGSMVLLYFLTRWGNELVEKSASTENKAQELFKKVKSSAQSMENTAVELDKNISGFNKEITGIYDASRGILDSVQQMSAAIQEEASSIYMINDSMNSSLQNINQTIEISKGIVAKSGEMSNKVDEGWNKINKINKKMDTVNMTIKSTADTVNELKVSLEEINILLQSIQDIAGQTNLLALNASIESARAGEQGKGFAVVAEQVRRLSEQSKEIAINITDVTSAIFSKAQEAAIRSLEGQKAASDSLSTINEVAEYFNEIKDSYKETDSELNKGMSQIETAAKNFTMVQEQITNVASISEENSASTQEILSFIEAENNQIATINGAVSGLHKLSSSLKNMVSGTN